MTTVEVGAQPFSRRAVTLLLVFGAISLLSGFVGVIVWGDAPYVRSSGNDSFSKSAIGHHALVELLERTGHRVLRSRGGSESKAGSSGVLLLVEPPNKANVEAMLADVERALIVLPKWRGEPHPRKSSSITTFGPVGAGRVSEVASAAGVDASVIRVGRTGWLQANRFAHDPDLLLPQLIEADDLDPLIESEHGILLGAIPNTPRHWVLADPDLLANHGLGRDNNAALVLAIIDDLAGDSVLVIDEALHGFRATSSVWAELGRFPLVLFLVQFVLTAVFLVWAGMRRFGAPLPSTFGLAAGKTVLIENTAELMTQSRHSTSVLRRYWSQARRQVAAMYHIPQGLSPEERRARLRRIGASETSFDEVEREVSNAIRGEVDELSVLRAARRVRAWREEMMNGTR